MQPVRCRPLRDAPGAAARMLRGRVLPDGKTVAAARYSPPRLSGVPFPWVYVPDAPVQFPVSTIPARVVVAIDCETPATWRSSLGSGSVQAGHREVVMPIDGLGEEVTATTCGGTATLIVGDAAAADLLYTALHIHLPQRLPSPEASQAVMLELYNDVAPRLMAHDRAAVARFYELMQVPMPVVPAGRDFSHEQYYYLAGAIVTYATTGARVFADEMFAILRIITPRGFLV
jgi:hypothetical protein